MHRIATLTLVVALPFFGAIAQAQTAPDAKPAVKAAAKAAPKPSTPRQELASEAKGLALGTETAESINANQLDISARVLTGKADCEFNQSVDVFPIPDRPGYFRVRFKNDSYVMVPEETSTGAVRLFERKSGVVWLQIPVKSMLLDSREGRRLVDSCLHSEQRAALNAVKDVGKSLLLNPTK